MQQGNPSPEQKQDDPKKSDYYHLAIANISTHKFSNTLVESLRKPKPEHLENA